MSNDAFEHAKREYLREQSQGNKNPFLVFLAAIVLIVIGVFINNANQDFIKNAKPTTGIAFYERNTSKSKADEDYYDIYVKYNVNGKEFYEYLKSEKYSGIANVGQKSGKEITIYYNTNNPTEIKDKSNSTIGIFLMGFGGLILITIIGYHIYRKTKKIPLNDPTPNYDAAAKVANFWGNVENNTGLYEKVEKVEKVASNIKKIIGSIVCLLIIGFGILCVVTDSSFSQNAKETTASVSRITKTEKRDTNNKRYIDTDVYVKYEVNGNQYEEIIDLNSESLTQGSKIKIFYKESNPKEIKVTNKPQFTGYIIMGVGLIFLLGCIFFPTNIEIKGK